MAERLVLAELDLDESAQVAAAGRARAAFVSLEGGANESARRIGTQWSRTTASVESGAALMTRRMFDMRLAVRALLGSFTLAGLVLAVTGLVKELITGTEWWKRFKEGAEDAHRAIILGETQANAALRHLTAA